MIEFIKGWIKHDSFPFVILALICILGVLVALLMVPTK